MCDFIYSSNNLLVGSIGLNSFGNAFISDVYEVFSINSQFNSLLIEAYVKQPEELNKMIKFRYGDLYGQYRIHVTDFLMIKGKVPSLNEQIKLTSFLNVLNKLIRTLRVKVNHINEQKRYLLSKVII